MTEFKNTAKGKGVRTAIQATIGTIAAFLIGLVAVVWAVPGVPEAVTNYLVNNAVQLLTYLGLSAGALSGVFSYLQNKAGK